MAGLVRQARGAGLLQSLARITSMLQPRRGSGRGVCCSRAILFPRIQHALRTRSSSNVEICMATVAWNYRRKRQLVPLGRRVPSVSVDAFVAPNLVLAGSVDVQDKASVFYGCVLRGDLNKIVVGFCSNVGDKCVLHATASSPTGLSAETQIGRYVTVGNLSTLRSCTIEDEVVIGDYGGFPGRDSQRSPGLLREYCGEPHGGISALQHCSLDPSDCLQLLNAVDVCSLRKSLGGGTINAITNEVVLMHRATGLYRPRRAPKPYR